MLQQDRQCTYNVALRSVHETVVAMEKQEYFTFVCACLRERASERARACVHVGTRARGRVHAHTYI